MKLGEGYICCCQHKLKTTPLPTLKPSILNPSPPLPPLAIINQPSTGQTNGEGQFLIGRKWKETHWLLAGVASAPQGEEGSLLPIGKALSFLALLGMGKCTAPLTGVVYFCFQLRGCLSFSSKCYGYFFGTVIPAHTSPGAAGRTPSPQTHTPAPSHPAARRHTSTAGRHPLAGGTRSARCPAPGGRTPAATLSPSPGGTALWEKESGGD